MLAVAAGTDLLCLGRDGSEDEYLAVRDGAGRRGPRRHAGREPAGRGCQPGRAPARGPGARPAAARRAPGRRGPRRGAGRRGRGPHRPGGGRTRATRLRDRGGRSASPVIIEIEPRENIAAGRFGWGLGPWAPPGSVRRVSVLGDDGVASDAAEILAAAAGRSLAVVVRDAHRDHEHAVAGERPARGASRSGPCGDGPAALAAAGGHLLPGHIRRLPGQRARRRRTPRPHLTACFEGPSPGARSACG